MTQVQPTLKNTVSNKTNSTALALLNVLFQPRQSLFLNSNENEIFIAKMEKCEFIWCEKETVVNNDAARALV